MLDVFREGESEGERRAKWQAEKSSRASPSGGDCMIAEAHAPSSSETNPQKLELQRNTSPHAQR